MNAAELARRISDFCRLRLPSQLPPLEVERLKRYLADLIRSRTAPPRRGAHGYDWAAIGSGCGISAEVLSGIGPKITPVFDAIVRALPQLPRLRPTPVPLPSKKDAKAPKPAKLDRAPQPSEPRTPKRRGRPPKPKDLSTPAVSKRETSPTKDVGTGVRSRYSDWKPIPSKPKKRTGPKPKPVVEFPPALWPDNHDPLQFKEALRFQMRRHDDTSWTLQRALVAAGTPINSCTILQWLRGRSAPRALTTLRALAVIERRYALEPGYLFKKIPQLNRAPRGHGIAGVTVAEMRRLAWHLPDDFEMRPPAQREEILEWVRTTIVSGTTDYRRFQAAAMKQRYALRFCDLDGGPLEPTPDGDVDDAFSDPEYAAGTRPAPDQLAAEMARLIAFKTSTLAPLGFTRSGVWNDVTASQKLEHLGLMFGALAASPTGSVRGRGVPLRCLTLAMLVFPAVWDWYVSWREARRGFYTSWEVSMLELGTALSRVETGWLRQAPQLAERLVPVPGLISQADIDVARADWSAACNAVHKHTMVRGREIQRVARVHRDPFEPILPILESDSPLAEYRKISEEILARMPDGRRYPVAAAEAVRSFLMLRFGLHLGVRQKNLRELLVRGRNEVPSTERQLERLMRGELRWSVRDHGWEVLIPASAFKNKGSSYFGGKPFKLLLPNLGRLYEFIDAYLNRHRRVLLHNAVDPGTFFVKSVKQTSASGAYTMNTFYEAWRFIIQRHGIFNPYTGRGAIKGLLPHGPHNVRDVLATHILKQTGSFEQASYAIQDTVETVAKHYGRFLPQDKAALAAKVLNKVWEAA